MSYQKITIAANESKIVHLLVHHDLQLVHATGNFLIQVIPDPNDLPRTLFHPQLLPVKLKYGIDLPVSCTAVVFITQEEHPVTIEFYLPVSTYKSR